MFPLPSTKHADDRQSTIMGIRCYCTCRFNSRPLPTLPNTTQLSDLAGHTRGMRLYRSFLCVLIASYDVVSTLAFVVAHRPNGVTEARNTRLYETNEAADETDVRDCSLTRRRMAFSMGAVTILSAFSCFPQPSHAAAKTSYVEGTTWLTGKAPQAPGDKPRDKNDTRGTRRDGSFLRSISDCKTQCESSNGADGLARSKQDCLSECQDICCESYEQCTFAIVPRI
jgi:hypothetical protein